jgi:UDP-glucuronate 4-epimerase
VSRILVTGAAGFIELPSLRSAHRPRPLQVLGDGHQTREFTYVSDALTTTIAAAELGTEPGYNVSGGTNSTLLEANAQIERLTDRPALISFSPSAQCDVYRTSANLSGAGRDLSYKPHVSSGDGLTLQIRAAMREPVEQAEAVA